MNHLIKILSVASVGLMGANIAASADQIHGNLSFDHPKYNVVDDLSAYGGDHRWPASDVVPDSDSKDTLDTAPEAASSDRVPVTVNFDHPKYNVVDDLSAYGGDHRWPASDIAPEPGSKDVATTSKPSVD